MSVSCFHKFYSPNIKSLTSKAISAHIHSLAKGCDTNFLVKSQELGPMVLFRFRPHDLGMPDQSLHHASPPSPGGVIHLSLLGKTWSL